MSRHPCSNRPRCRRWLARSGMIYTSSATDSDPSGITRLTPLVAGASLPGTARRVARTSGPRAHTCSAITRALALLPQGLVLPRVLEDHRGDRVVRGSRHHALHRDHTRAPSSLPRASARLARGVPHCTHYIDAALSSCEHAVKSDHPRPQFLECRDPEGCTCGPVRRPLSGHISIVSHTMPPLGARSSSHIMPRRAIRMMRDRCRSRRLAGGREDLEMHAPRAWRSPAQLWHDGHRLLRLPQSG